MPLTRKGTQWRYARNFVLRLTGFPFDLLERLQFDQTAARYTDLVNARTQQSLGSRPDPAKVKAEVINDFQRELRLRRETLVQIAKSEKFLEAVLLCSPAAFERIKSYVERPIPEVARSKEARIERLITSYLQRFCAKNESASFFGPVSYGTVEEIDAGFIEAVPKHRLKQRKMFFSHWAAQQINGALAADTSRVEPTSRIPTNATYPLDYVIDELEGKTGAAATAVLDTVRTIKGSLDEFPNAALPRKVLILDSINDSFTRITSSAAYRGAGKHYSDRMVVYEDCEYDIPGLRLHPDVLERLSNECRVVFDLVCFFAETKFAQLRKVLHQWCLSEFGEKQTITLAVLTERLEQKREQFQSLIDAGFKRWQKACEPVLKYFAALLDATEDTHCITLSQAQLDAIDKLLQQSEHARWPVFMSPDLLLEANSTEAINEGNFKIVLGEIHPSLGINGYYSVLHPRSERVVSEVESILASISGDMQPINFLTETHNKTFIALDLPFADIEFSGGALPGKLRLKMDDLYLFCNEQDVYLHARHCINPLFIYSKMPNLLNVFPLSFFTYPLCSTQEFRKALFKGRKHTPRIECGPLVVSRETWHVPIEELRGCNAALTSADKFVRTLELKDRYELPRHVFVSIAAEPKPIYVDFHNWLLIDVLLHKLKDTTSQSVTFTEMVPGPESLWLEDADGKHSCEFRLLFYRGE